ncbi:MAG: prepilin peptidase [Candidatus Aureabacteria bacterium]|nr:prepilin peptidase [Candidatus Auribacterota bacterium]
MDFLYYPIIFIYGLAFGSFFNVCIFRIPKGLSLVFPASHCPNCKNLIPWYHNIPLFSYLFLKGRCAKCRIMISPVYPVIEILTGIIAVLIFWHLRHLSFSDWIIRSGIYFVFFGSLLILSVIDIRYFIIPDRFSIGGMVLGVAAATLYPSLLGFHTAEEGFIHSLVSCGICFFVLNGIRVLGSAAYKREAMGFGDIKLAGAFGAFLGWKLGLLSIFLGAMWGSVFGIAAIVFSFQKLRSEIPFGPFLSLGAFTSFLFGNDILHWYGLRFMM